MVGVRDDTDAVAHHVHVWRRRCVAILITTPTSPWVTRPANAVAASATEQFLHGVSLPLTRQRCAAKKCVRILKCRAISPGSLFASAIDSCDAASARRRSGCGHARGEARQQRLGSGRRRHLNEREVASGEIGRELIIWSPRRGRGEAASRRRRRQHAWVAGGAATSTRATEQQRRRRRGGAAARRAAAEEASSSAARRRRPWTTTSSRPRGRPSVRRRAPPEAASRPHLGGRAGSRAWQHQQQRAAG